MSIRFTPLGPANTAAVDNISFNYTATLLANQCPTVILIHGFGASLRVWDDIYPLLSANYSVIRLDLKGSGFSSKPKDDQYAPSDQAYLLLKLLKQLGQTNVVLVGHSLGGGVALITYFESMISAQDITVRGLILIDSAGYSQKLPFFVSVVRNPITRFFSYLMPAYYRVRFVLNRIMETKDRITADRIHKYSFFLNQSGSRYALCQTAKQILPQNASELASKISMIQIPTLIVWGENDPVIPVENAFQFRKAIQKAQLAVLPDTGHIPQEERPTETFSAMNQF